MFDEFDKIKIGKRIRELRIAQGLSQDELCDRMGILDSSYLSKVETGKYATSLKILFSVMKALNVEPNELFNYEHLTTESSIDEKLGLILTKLTLEQKQCLYRIASAVFEMK